MSTSVGTKVRKKHSPAASSPAATERSRRGELAVEQALQSLENVCFRISEIRFARRGDDTDRLYWQQRFRNTVMPITLALEEYRGPQRFHNHYRHREDDDAILQPVLENPLTLLANVCTRALKQCQSKLVGLRDADLIEAERALETALQHFLIRYGKYKLNA